MLSKDFGRGSQNFLARSDRFIWRRANLELRLFHHDPRKFGNGARYTLAAENRLFKRSGRIIASHGVVKQNEILFCVEKDRPVCVY